ncbi:hypothetical protein [Xenorhabdus beddingii]|uniref:hypothetical protein n=1 Tax=Xenorhabdus beddingii TaxID=40578 RepID=UPI000A325FB0
MISRYRQVKGGILYSVLIEYTPVIAKSLLINAVPSKLNPPTKIRDETLITDVQNYPNDYQWEKAKRLGVTQSASRSPCMNIELQPTIDVRVVFVLQTRRDAFI